MGTVSVIDCQPTGRQKSSWRCDGEFTSDDGTVHIDRLQLFPVFDERPSGSFEARVSGPDATIATSPTGASWLVPIGGGVGFAALSGSFAYRCFPKSPSRYTPKSKTKRKRREHR